MEDMRWLKITGYCILSDIKDVKAPSPPSPTQGKLSSSQMCFV